jgi:PleD family two-component response regulator
MSDAGGTDPDSLLADADAAMYAAKPGAKELS